MAVIRGTETAAFHDRVWEKIEEKMHRVVLRNRDVIPYTTGEDGRYQDIFKIAPAMWTNGFWPGILWYLYQASGDELYREEAVRAEEKLDGPLLGFDTGHVADHLDHDVGFLWQLSAGADYRLTGSVSSYRRTMLAADCLMARFNPDGHFFTAWNGKDREGWSIIDTMMNLPLLYRASEISGYSRYKKAAMAHADHAMEGLIRPDGSSAHIAVYDCDTGELKEHLAGQGAAFDSAWSRGQGWAVYGFALSYRYTKKSEYLATAKKAANYFAACVSQSGYVPRSDFRGAKELMDTTAGVIAANGMLELAEWVPEGEKRLYAELAYRILKALTEEHCCWSMDSDAILTDSSERYTDEKEMTIIYGDYFLIEAILRLKGTVQNLW